MGYISNLLSLPCGNMHMPPPPDSHLLLLICVTSSNTFSFDLAVQQSFFTFTHKISPIFFLFACSWYDPCMIFLMIRRNHRQKMAVKVIAAVKMRGGQRKRSMFAWCFYCFLLEISMRFSSENRDRTVTSRFCHGSVAVLSRFHC